MSRFLVDSVSLDRVRDRLGVLHGQLQSVPVIVGSYTDTMLGGRLLEAELDGFAREWHREVTGVAGEIEVMQVRLTAAATAYRQIEERQRERARHARHRSPAPTPRAAHPEPRSGHSEPRSGHSEPHRRGSGRGSGTTVIDGGGSGSGSGTTVIDPGAGQHHHPAPSSSGSGTTVIGGVRIAGR